MDSVLIGAGAILLAGLISAPAIVAYRDPERYERLAIAYLLVLATIWVCAVLISVGHTLGVDAQIAISTAEAQRLSQDPALWLRDEALLWPRGTLIFGTIAFFVFMAYIWGLNWWIGQ